MRNILAKLKASPTIATWTSYCARALNLLVVLPIALSIFSPEEINVWNLILIFLSLQTLFDMGFSLTFVRMIAYCFSKGETQVDWNRLSVICTTMRVIYSRLSILALFVLGIVGTVSLIRPISFMQSQSSVWTAWAVSLASLVFVIRGQHYSVYIQGWNRITLLKYWEALMLLGNAIIAITILLLTRNLAAVVISNALMNMLAVQRNKFLVKKLATTKNAIDIFRAKYDKEVFTEAWAMVWKTAVGMLCSLGIIQLSAVILAQVATASVSAQYSISLRLFQNLNAFSNAPFYSKLPLLGRLLSQGRNLEFVKVASKNIFYSLVTYSFSYVILVTCGQSLLNLTSSNLLLPLKSFIPLFGIAFFFERLGAMHLQMFTITNKVIWHTVNGATALICFVACMLIYPHMNAIAFPVSLLCGYAGYYSWYTMLVCFREFKIESSRYLCVVVAAPFLITLATALLCVYAL